MGAKTGQKLTPSKPGFKHPISISNIKEAYWWGSGGNRSFDRLLVRAHVRYLCQLGIILKIGQKQSPAPTQAARVVFFTPNSTSSLFVLILLQFASKKEHAQTVHQSPPSGTV